MCPFEGQRDPTHRTPSIFAICNRADGDRQSVHKIQGYCLGLRHAALRKREGDGDLQQTRQNLHLAAATDRRVCQSAGPTLYDTHWLLDNEGSK
jgi:hypothetical protein